MGRLSEAANAGPSWAATLRSCVELSRKPSTTVTQAQAQELAGDETRTRDHLLGRQALYQLSYSRVAANSSGLRPVVDPGLAFGVDLFLPDRHGVLQLIDQPLAGIEGLTAMRRRHGDHHADLPDLKRTCAVDDREVQDAPPPAGLFGEAFH